ncbi:MAG: ABC transporter permease [Methanomassiliicoccales archaeon]
MNWIWDRVREWRQALPAAREVPGMLWEHLRLHPVRSIGQVILLSLILMALFAPSLAPHDPGQRFLPYQDPSGAHPLGTNDIGNDVLSELIYGSRVSLLVGFLAAAISVVIGSAVGMVAGYHRGLVEQFLMGTTDLFLLIPALPLMIVLAAYLDPSMWNIVLVIGILWWCPTARVVHSRVLQVRETGFVESTKAMGFSAPYILVRHVLPNTREVILAHFGLTVAVAMLTEASLSFLGLGDPLHISWGNMLNFAFNRGGFFNDMYWWYLPPGIMISLAVLAFVLISTDRERRSRFFRWI